MLFIHILIYSKLYIIQPTKIVIGNLLFVVGGNCIISIYNYFYAIFFTNFNKILKYIYNNQHIIIQRRVKNCKNFLYTS